jgi:hypothetical protein
VIEKSHLKLPYLIGGPQTLPSDSTKPWIKMFSELQKNIQDIRFMNPLLFQELHLQFLKSRLTLRASETRYVGNSPCPFLWKAAARISEDSKGEGRPRFDLPVGTEFYPLANTTIEALGVYPVGIEGFCPRSKVTEA